MRSSMNVKTSQKGFTLIELVVVIVILGILAVTAAPKFIDLTGDAKKSVVEAVEGALNSAADMAHAKALVDGTGDPLSIAGQTITFANTYPNAASIDLLMDIDAAVSGTPADFVLATSGSGRTYTHAKATTPAECYAIYTETADANVKPVIDSVTTGC